MLPKKILEVIKKHEERIYKDIPSDEIIVNLIVNEVLNDDEISQIWIYDDNECKNLVLIEILKKHEIKDFFIFCAALKNVNIKNVQELGALLENDANEAINSGGIINNTNV